MVGGGGQVQAGCHQEKCCPSGQGAMAAPPAVCKDGGPRPPHPVQADSLSQLDQELWATVRATSPPPILFT